jgi:DNA adenine methylase
VRLTQCRASVVLSGYASPLYDDLLCTWSRRELATQTGNGGSDRERTEVIWSNRAFPFAQPDLFSEVAG